MTTLINFNPAPTANFQFNPTLDGNDYVAICSWNAYGQRYYVSIYDNYEPANYWLTRRKRH